MKVETKRMLLQPMSDNEIEEMMAEMHSDDLRAAYGEMLAGCRREPENRIWYAPWKMTLKNSREYMGDVGFKGPAKDRTVEIGYGILPSYEGNGYMTEAVQAMIRWAFAQQDVDLWKRKPTRTTAHPSAYWKNAALWQTEKQGRKAPALWWSGPKQPER